MIVKLAEPVAHISGVGQFYGRTEVMQNQSQLKCSGKIIRF